ncbi:MAG: hypothetical protein ACRYHQ_34665, partial [Janthinobacterium lividum]
MPDRAHPNGHGQGRFHGATHHRTTAADNAARSQELAYHAPAERDAAAVGQIQIWLDLAFTASCVLLVRGRSFAAGAAMGF